NYWSALTDATSVKDGKLRLKVLISELEHRGYESAARSSPTTSTPWWSTCATRSDTANGGGQRISSRDPSVRSAGAPRSWAASPARPAASHSSGPCSTCSSATPATTPPSPMSTANTSAGSSTGK